MAKYENIEGDKRHALMHSLLEGKTLVRLFVPSGDFESLTLVTDIGEDGGKHYFTIDPPAGLIEEIAKNRSTALRFEFHSGDHVTHKFEAALMRVTMDTVLLDFPDIVLRHQKRDNFRVEPFSESYATVCVKDAEVRMQIKNISLGGVYCHCRNTYKNFFEENLRLKDMDLFLTLRNECFIVPIQRIEVRRLENHPKPKHFGVAFEFIKINRDAQKRLVQQIYELQREFLQNRLKLSM